MIFMQTKAIFVDAYRELNAKKLFWLTMGLNLLAVVLFASLGVNERGFSVLFWTIEGLFNSSMMSKETFYKFEFITWGVPYWLSWGATILALISTAGIIPDMISSGAIEPMLSKPIGRVRYFLTKYLTGLMFVFMQILVFSLGCFLVMGIRGGAWELGLFLAIPIVLAFFSYLYAFCALMGIVTRSTIASLLLTIVFWLLVFIVHAGEASMISLRENAVVKLEDAPAMVESQERFAEKRIEQLRAQGREIPGEGGAPLPDGAPDSLQAINSTLGTARERQAEAEREVQTWNKWSGRVSVAKLVLPKTQETIALLQRNLIDEEELSGFIDMMQGLDQRPDEDRERDSRAQERIQAIYDNRSMGWILGTSFAFEGVMLLLSSIIFTRRDF